MDAAAIEGCGIPGSILMARAAQACCEVMTAVWGQPSRVQVLCGTGNNGGDGYLIAHRLHQRGIPVQVLELGNSQKIQSDARKARDLALDAGVPSVPYVDGCLEGDGILVDAMLGTGLGGDVRPVYASAIEAVNAAGLPVLAVDVPSGLCADTGRILGSAVTADITVTFIALKRGLFTLDGPDCVGELEFADLAVPDTAHDCVAPDVWRLDLDTLLAELPPRPATAHKGHCGSVLVIGGDEGMGGASLMAAEAALRCGAGLVRLATREQHVAAAIARIPEIMAHGVAGATDVRKLIDASDVLVVGPGLGQSEWSKACLQVALQAQKPCVLDADALNLLASGDVQSADLSDSVLTPHPGEAARLLGCAVGEIQTDRFAAATALTSKLGATIVLKGNGTLVASQKGIGLCDYGNPGMASGGMGDVLSGVLGALIAQGLAADDAAPLGVCLHSAAADIAALDGERGLLATDLIPVMRELLD